MIFTSSQMILLVGLPILCSGCSIRGLPILCSGCSIRGLPILCSGHSIRKCWVILIFTYIPGRHSELGSHRLDWHRRQGIWA